MINKDTWRIIGLVAWILFMIWAGVGIGHLLHMSMSDWYHFPYAMTCTLVTLVGIFIIATRG